MRSLPDCAPDLRPDRRGSQPAAALARSAPKQRKIKYWRAPMNPNYISDKPGKSPMGMDLIPVYEDEQAQETGFAWIPASFRTSP